DAARGGAERLHMGEDVRAEFAGGGEGFAGGGATGSARAVQGIEGDTACGLRATGDGLRLRSRVPASGSGLHHNSRVGVLAPDREASAALAGSKIQRTAFLPRDGGADLLVAALPFGVAAGGGVGRPFKSATSRSRTPTRTGRSLYLSSSNETLEPICSTATLRACPISRSRRFSMAPILVSTRCSSAVRSSLDASGARSSFEARSR